MHWYCAVTLLSSCGNTLKTDCTLFMFRSLHTVIFLVKHAYSICLTMSRIFLIDALKDVRAITQLKHSKTNLGRHGVEWDTPIFQTCESRHEVMLHIYKLLEVRSATLFYNLSTLNEFEATVHRLRYLVSLNIQIYTSPYPFYC